MFLFNLIHSFDTKVFASVVHRDTFPVSINFSSYAVNNTLNSGYSGFFIIYSALGKRHFSLSMSRVLHFWWLWAIKAENSSSKLFNPR